MKDLKHANNQKVKAALAQAKEHGDAKWVRPLLEAYAVRKEDALREEMRDMLGTLKISAAEQTFLDALVDTELSHVKADVLGFLWSCGFTCEGALSRVLDVACEGDFQQAFEGVTLLEQVESVTDEKGSWDVGEGAAEPSTAFRRLCSARSAPWTEEGGVRGCWVGVGGGRIPRGFVAASTTAS